MKQICLAFGILCAIQSSSSALANGSEYPALLQYGYDHIKLEHKATQCVEGTVVDRVHKEFDVRLSKVENWEQLQVEMNFGVPGSIILKSDSALAKFTAYARDTRFTSSYLLQGHVSVQEKVLVNPKLTNTEKDPEHFRDECGTKYVTSIRSGASLHVAIRFTFSDFESKIDFDAGGAKEISEIGARIGALSKTARKDSSVQIFAHQVGGDLGEVNKLFNSKNVVSCSLDKFELCESLLEEVWNYAKGHFATSAAANAQTIGFQTDEYPNGFKFIESPFVVRERIKLVRTLNQMDYDKDSLFSMKGVALRDYPTCDDRCLTNLISSVMANSRTLRDSILLSFDDPELFKAEGTLDKLELIKIQIPVKKTDYYGMFMSNLHFIIPTTFFSVVLPVVYKAGNFGITSLTTQMEALK